MYFIGLLYPLITLAQISGLGVSYSLLLILISFRYVLYIQRSALFLSLLLLLGLPTLGIDIIYLIGIVSSYVFVNALGLVSAKRYALGLISGFGLIILIAIYEISIGVSRSFIVGGLTSVVVGRYVIYVLFLCIILQNRHYNKLIAFSGLVTIYLQAKTAAAVLVLLLFRRFYTIFLQLSPVGVTILSSIVVFFISLWLPYIIGSNGNDQLAGMVNRLTWMNTAYIRFINFDLLEYIIGSQILIDSHFAFFDILLNYGFLGSAVFLYILHRLFQDTLRFPTLLPMLFIIFLATNMSGGLWSLKESLMVVLLGLRVYKLR